MSKLQIKQGVRIRDVAAAAGVSKTTVSLIVNGRADQVGISLATRQRVTDLVRQMGYVPSSAAREMATGQVAVAAEAAPVAVSADSTNAISANA
ncbi:MAG: LacI family DNA-binding transcriptional regulator [bacterium]